MPKTDNTWKFNPIVRKPRSGLSKRLGINPYGEWVHIETNEVCTALTGTPVLKILDPRYTPLIESAPELLAALMVITDEFEAQYDGANTPDSATELERLRIISECRKLIKRANKQGKESL